MNLKAIFFLASSLMVVVSGQPELPDCSGDVEACTTARDEEGYFICRVQDEESSLRPTRPPTVEGTGRGRRGRRGFSRSKCVPVDPPELDGTSPFGGDRNRPQPRLECGCCDEVCPVKVECGCPCDITRRNGDIIQGSKATITMRDGTQINQCVPPMYADEDRFTCITDCSVETTTPTPEEDEEIP